MAGALEGIKVVEAGLLVQGPQAAATLGQWGAEVIKAELPVFGDQARWLPVQNGDFRSAYFAACNRGKRSLTVDLRRPEGREVFFRLAAWADVVITNFKPGTMESWGLGFEDLAAGNPRLVYAAGSTFGSAGADTAREGADLSAQAVGGLISTTGRAGGEPSPVGATIADHIAALNLVGGILAALLARERTGVGQQVETSLVGGQLWAQASEITGCLMTGRPGGPAERSNPYVHGLYGIFPTADGWLAIVGVVGKARAKFFELIGRPELSEQFAQPLYFAEDKAALFPLLDEALRARPTAEWCELLAAAGLRFAPVRDHGQVVEDPGVWENGYLVRAPGADGGETPVVAAPVRFSQTPAEVVADVPELGQHTEEVLLELGYSWDEITALSDAGAI